MGKTVESYRMALESEISRWNGFAKVLRSEEPRAFEGCVSEQLQRQVIKSFAKYTSTPADTGEQPMKDTKKATLTAFSIC